MASKNDKRKHAKRRSLRKKDFLVVRDTKTLDVARVVSPKHFQIGLDDPEFRSSLKVMGYAKFMHGMTGSLQKLIDGSDYLKGDANITVTNNVDGSISIGATAANFSGTTTNPLTVGDGIKLDSDTTFTGAAAKTISLDFAASSGLKFSSGKLAIDPASATEVTPAAGDFFLITDATDGAVKKVKFSAMSSATQGDVTLDNPLGAGSGLTLTSGNSEYDNSSAETININLAANSGLAITGDAIHVSPNTATVKADPEDDDTVLISDSSAGHALKKVTVSSLGNASNTLSNVLTVSDGLELDSGAIYNNSAARTIKVKTDGATISNSASGISVASIPGTLSAGTGISALSFNGSSNTSVSVDSAAVATFASGGTFAGNVTFDGSVYGKFNEISAGLPFIVGGTNVTVVTGSDGQVTVSAAGTIDISGYTNRAPDLDDVLLFEQLNESPQPENPTSYSTISSVLNLVDRTSLVQGSNTISVDNSDPLVASAISVKLNGDSLAQDINGLKINKLLKQVSSGTGIKTFSFDGSNNATVEVDDSVFAKLSGAAFTGVTSFNSGISGSIYNLMSGLPYITGGSGILVTTSSAGQVIVTNIASGGGGGLAIDSFPIDLEGGDLTDSMAIADADDNNLSKKITLNQLKTLVGGGASVFQTISVSGQSNVVADSATDTLTLAGGANVTITTDAGTDTVTIAAAASGDSFKTISVSGQSDIVADSVTDTLTLAAGANIAITTNAGTDAVTIAATDTNTTYAAGDGLDLSGTTFSADLKGGGGLAIEGGEIKVATSAIAGTGLEDSGTDQIRIATSAAGTGLKGGGGDALEIDLNELNSALVDPANDSIVIIDANASNGSKKESIVDLMTTVAGAGLAASAGVLSIDIDELAALGSTGLHQTQDHFIFSDNGTEKKITFSNLEDAIFGHITGDAAITAGGALTIAATSVEGSMLNNSIISGQTEMTGDVADTDEILISDDGTIKRADFSVLRDAVFNDISGDASIAAGGALTIGTNAIQTGMVHDDVATELAGIGLGAASGVLSLDLNELSAAAVDVANDSIAIIDANDSNVTKKESIADVVTAAAGTGLAAASGVLSIDYAGDDSVIKSATSGTDITVDAANDLLMIYDNDASAVKYIKPNQLPGGTIGAAEDGSYADGLFTDFTTSTPVGTPVDRFNEILKLLVPAPAPDLDDIDVNSDGTDVKLSFGTSNDQSAASPAYVNVAASAGIGAAVDVNGDYATAASSNNLRAAVYNGATNLIGDLNEDIPANITTPSNETNYVANSLGDANVGSLVLELNGVDIYTLDLTLGSTGTGVPGSGSGTHINASGDYEGSGFINVSAVKSGTFDNGTSFDNFKHRTGKWKVATTGAVGQKNGWNYARVKHVKGITVTTNYIEWVNDPDANALSAASNSLAFTGTGSLQISGVTYFTGGNAQYQVTVSNAYRYVYDTTATSFTTSNAGTRSSVTYNIGNVAKASIGGAETHLKQIVINETDSVTANYILGGSITAGVTVSHPIKTNLTNAGQSSETGILLYNVSDTATVTSETFQREVYRLQLDAYANQSDVTGGSLNWNSATSLVGGGTHGDGLQIYRERLYAPKNTLNSGDFRNTSDGGSLANGPSSNPNYSAATGLRTYYRKFKNAGAAKRDLSYTIQGDVTLVANGTAVGANDKFRLYFKMPSDGAGNTTGWLDAKTAFSYNTVTDNAGCAIGAVDTSNAMTNNITFGTVEVGTDEWVVAKIVTDDDWSGYLDSFAVTFGAVNAVNGSPNVNDIDCNQSGVNAKLSFGATLAKGGYTAISTAAGFSAVNANGAYNLSGDRRAIFNGGQVISGDINETTSASGNNYPANAFGSGKAHQGSLKLEVNGSVIHTADLTSFGSGSSLTSSSGFINLSAATVGEDNNSLPDYTKFYRTGQFQVAIAAQRNGWNYVRVIHSLDGSDYASAYVEWVNDDSNPTISFSGVAVGNFTSGSTYQCSGVTYFISPTGRFDFTVANLYKYVYSSNASAISFPTTTNSTVTSIVASGDGVTNSTVNAASRTLPALDTSVSDAYDDDLVVQATFSFDQGTSIPGETAYSVTLTGRVHHPLEGNTTTSSTSSAELLVANFSDNSSNTNENFNGEAKRLKAGTTSYTTQTHISGGSNNWNSATSMDGADAAHNTGLIVYDGKLRSPQKVGPSGNLGDFRDSGQSGTIIAPNGNPDYGSLTNATREYIRWFKNTAGASKTNFDLTINGTGTIVQNTESLASSNKLQVFAKIPHSSSDQSTGWMDTAKAFASGQNGDNAGALVGSHDSSLNATNEVTFGTKFVDNNEYILIKIVADKTWTGNITQMSVSWS